MHARTFAAAGVLLSVAPSAFALPTASAGGSGLSTDPDFGAASSGPATAHASPTLLSIASDGTAKYSKQLTYLAGYRSTPRGGLKFASATFTVPAVTCTNPDPEGTALGIGSEDTVGSPTYLADLDVECADVATPAYVLEASVCSTDDTSQDVQVGDTVKTTVTSDGTNVTVTTQDAANGTTVKASGAVGNCGGKLDSVTVGSFPLFGPGGKVPVGLPQLSVDNTCQCLAMQTPASQPRHKLVRRDGTFTVTPKASRQSLQLYWMLVYVPSCHYLQEANENSNSAESVVWEADGSLTNQGADDFTMSTRCTVTSMDARGSYWTSNPPFVPADSETVTFYADSGGLPGAMISTQHVVGSDPTGQGMFHIPLSLLLFQPSVTYWVSVQADMPVNEGAGDGWFWNLLGTQHGNAGAFRWPGGQGFCPTWNHLPVCFPGFGLDYSFNLS